MSTEPAPAVGGPAAAAPSSAAPPPDGGLRRQVGFLGLMWTSEGSIIGSGWLLGAFAAATAAGTASLLSWVIGVASVTVLALVHAELGGMFPVAGGTARYPSYAFGGLAGFSFGWFSWLQAVTVAPIEVEAALTYGSVHLPWLQHADKTLTPAGYAVAVALLAVFVAVNMLGVRLLAETNTAATWWKVGVPLLTIAVVALYAFHPANFGAAGGFAPFGAHGVLEAVSTGGIIFALLGFEQAVQLAGESRNPGRDIPRAVLGSLFIGATLYLLLEVVFIGALPTGSLAHGWAHLSFAGDAGPFAGLATAAGAGWLAAILYIDAVISPGGSGLIYTTATSRLSYGLARAGHVPASFARTDARRGVPWFGLLFAFGTGLLVLLPFPSWQKMVGFVTSAGVLMYAGAPLALSALRHQLPDLPRPFRMPGARVLSPLAFVVANLVIYWSGWPTVWRLGVAVVLGYALMAAARLTGSTVRRPALDWRAAQWLPGYLLGMGVISWLGGFGGAGKLPLWWDMLVIAAFSLGIHAWAMAVRLPDAAVRAALAAETAQAGPAPQAAAPATAGIGGIGLALDEDAAP